MNHRHLRPAPTASRPVAPFHRGPQAHPAATTGAVHSNTSAPNAAMLIDFDNVTMGIRSDLQAELKNLLSSDIIKGKVAVRRAYADWRRYPQYIVPLTESSIDLIFAPAYGSSKKNATDIRLAIDALELVFTRPEIGTFVLLSGDSDFSSMVIKLKEYGKYVIGVGIRESSSDLLVMNCDEYYSYNALAGLVKTGDDESTRWDPWDLVTEAVTRMKRNGDVMRSDRLKQVMQEIDSSFDEKDLGKSKFSKFVQDAADKGLLRTTKLENGQLEVDVPIGGPPPVAKPAAATEGEAAPAAAAPAEVVRERAERPDRPDRPDRDDRRGRRGRRGRGRDREREPREARDASHDGDQAAEPAVAGAEAASAALAAPSAPAFHVAPTFPAPSPAFGDPATDTIGRGGERLTRIEAFELVKKAVEALVSGEETTSASAVRQRAHEILGRDSESLSARNFERILRDSHDADMIDLRRRGNDFEIARAADAAPIVEQLKSAEQAHQAKVAANAPPAAPRGMAHRGLGGKVKGPRGAAPISPDMLLVGAVRSAAPAANATANATANTAATPAAPAPAAATPSAAASSASATSAQAEEKLSAPAKRGGKAPKGAKTSAKKAAKPAKAANKASAKSDAKPAAAKKEAKPAKTAAKKAAKAARPA